MATHLSTEQIAARLDHIRDAPRDDGTLALIVRRPAIDAREVLEHGELSVADGLVGDTWKYRGSSRTPDFRAHPNMQINVMNVRVIEVLAQEPARWPLAGDQLFVDLDLSEANLPAGTQLAVGDAVIEVTPEPHTGCGKFVERFGIDAMKFVNGTIGRPLRLRGLNARVVKAGRIRRGDPVRKTPGPSS